MGAMTTEATMMYTFNTPGPIDLRVELWQGRVEVVADDVETTTVELTPLRGDSAANDAIDNARVEQRGNEIVVLMPKAKGGLFRGRAEIEAEIRVPTSSNAHIETASADIETRGVLGDVKASSGSGEVSIEEADDLEVRTGSGDIKASTVNGSCTVRSGSADVEIGEIGADADVKSGSGDVLIDSVGAKLSLKTGSGDLLLKSAGHTVDAMAGSGDLLVKRIEQGKVRMKTGSGDVSIGVAQGTAAYLDIMTVTGDVASELDAASGPSDGERTVDINVQSGSGDVVLQRS
jgi:DUF4097 and DUF4098 domain-containing protein YvlB